MKENILNLIDFEKVDTLLEGFNKTTGFVTAILDLDGKVLSKSGWRQMCTHFHRTNSESSKMCTISDTVLAGKMADGEKYHFYKCLNGLVDVAVPIVINEEHIANLFSGQFFFEEPDKLFFKKQAEKYGFDVKEYLEALDKVPIVSKERVKTAMDFLLSMTQFISEMTFQKLEQKELNLVISSKEEQQRMILQTAMDGFWMVDLKGKFIELNEIACKMVGYTRAELLKLSIFDLEIVETAEQTKKHIQTVLEIGEDRFQTKHRGKDGQIIDVELSVKFQSAQNLIVAFVHDITERVQNENEIADLVERLTLSMEVSKAGTWDWDIRNNNFFWSDEFLKIFGMEPDTVPGFDSWTKSLHPDDIEAASKKIQDAVDEKTDLLSDYRIFLSDGTLRWIRSMGKVTYQNEIPIRMIALCLDITEQKLAEEQLRTRETKFRAVAELSPMAIYASSGSDQKAVYINQAFYKIFGFSIEDVPTVGHWWIEAFPDEKYRQWVMETWQKNIEDGNKNNTEVEVLECVCNCKDGSEKNIAWVGKTIGDEFWAFGYDLTERKLAEEALVKNRESLQQALDVSNRSRQSLLSVLEDQRLADREIQKLNAELEQRVIQRTAQLEAANKELETFTYSVSHDLKAPLRGIDGYSKLLMDIHGKNLNEEAKAFISTIRSSTLQMNQLIEDLLEYSRLERSNLRNEKVNLIDLINSLTSLYENELRNSNFLLKLDLPDVELMTDEKGLSIILRNILENAIKFTKEKANPIIEIGFKDQPSSWIIHIKDNGIGFDMKYHSRIFEIFQRLHRAEDYSGTGIGLAMVSKGMQRMNGKVWAESIPGEGSVFFLEIPKLGQYENKSAE